MTKGYRKTVTHTFKVQLCLRFSDIDMLGDCA